MHLSKLSKELKNGIEILVYQVVFVGRQLCWKDRLDFRCHSVCVDVLMDDVGFSSTKRTELPIFIKLGMQVVVGTGVTHVVCRHQMRILNRSLAYLFRLANNKKGKYQ